MANGVKRSVHADVFISVPDAAPREPSWLRDGGLGAQIAPFRVSMSGAIPVRSHGIRRNGDNPDCQASYFRSNGNSFGPSAVTVALRPLDIGVAYFAGRRFFGGGRFSAGGR